MKKMIIFLVFSISVFQSFSQRNNRKEHSKDYYLNKSKGQKTSGTILLIGGSLLTVIGIGQVSQQDNVFEAVASTFAGGTEIFVGACLDIMGVCNLLSSRKNAKKAAKISFNNQKYLLPMGNFMALKMQPTVTLKIPLGTR